MPFPVNTNRSLFTIFPSFSRNAYFQRSLLDGGRNRESIPRMKLTGISDEAGGPIEAQIRAHNELGWDTIEARFVKMGDAHNGSIHEIPQAAFDKFAGELDSAGISVCGVGSTIGNWAHSINDAFEITEAEMARCIERMNRLGSKIVRVMSYAILEEEKEQEDEDQKKEERFRRMRIIKDTFDAAGITPVHENCMNYGGMSVQHALELQENVPGLKWVFDTGNPVFNGDRSKERPYPRQDAWEFYEAIKPHIVHVHIKDGKWVGDDCVFTMPGEGDGKVEQILTDLHKTGYDGYLSIEPHIAAVFHSTDDKDDDPESKARDMFNSYVEYGKRMEEMVKKITA